MKTPAGAGLRTRDGRTLAVPETAVIDTGRQKVVYRESLPNTFDGVLVGLGPKLQTADGAVYYPVLSGLRAGDRVAAAGAFLLDAETRLNPAMGSIYVGGSSGGSTGGVVRPTTPADEGATVAAAMSQLPPADRKAAEAQGRCPVLGGRLGLMGVPVKVDLGGGRAVFVCCKSCIAKAKAAPEKALRDVAELKKGPSAAPAAVPPVATPPAVPKLTAEDLAEIRASLPKLSPDDRKAVEAQKLCPVQGNVLGTMGVPIKVDLGGSRSVFVCCKGCITKARKDPEGVLKKVEEFKKLPPVLPEGKP
jgi:hypothetical protein